MNKFIQVFNIIVIVIMLYRQLLDQQAAPTTILNSGAKSPLTKAFVQLAPILDQPNTISSYDTKTSQTRESDNAMQRYKM